MEQTISAKQLEANRNNAKKSTGPRTEEGKMRSSTNSFKHGILAENVVPRIPGFGESETEFQELLDQLRMEHKPVGLLEECCVQQIGWLMWRLGRVARAEKGAIEQRSLDYWDGNKQMMHLASLMSTLDPRSGHLYSRQILFPEGIDALLEAVDVATNEMVTSKCINPSTLRVLEAFFGEHLRGFAFKVSSMVSAIRRKDCESSEGDCDKSTDKKGKKEKPPEYPYQSWSREQLVSTILVLLNGARKRLLEMRPEVEAVAAFREDVGAEQRSIPDHETSLKLMRYETSLRNALKKEVEHFHKLQDRRMA